MSDRKFFRTVLVIEVLTEGAAFDGDFEQLATQCLDGAASGDVRLRAVEVLRPREMAARLVGQDSDPGLFALTKSGHDILAEELWVEPLSGPGVYGPFEDEAEASSFMYENGLSDEEHTLVWRAKRPEGAPNEDLLILHIHKATPGAHDEDRCGTCEQPIHPVMGMLRSTWVHSDSGAVAAPNPPAHDTAAEEDDVPNVPAPQWGPIVDGPH